MKFLRRKRAQASVEIAVTPLVDLFLNILIFFLVTTTFAADTVFYVDLPEAETAEEVGEERQIAISVGSSGELALNNRRIAIDELTAKLEQVPQARRPVIPVVLRADREAVHGKVVTVIDMVRKAGFSNIGIVTQTGSGEKP